MTGSAPTTETVLSSLLHPEQDHFIRLTPGSATLVTAAGLEVWEDSLSDLFWAVFPEGFPTSPWANWSPPAQQTIDSPDYWRWLTSLPNEANVLDAAKTMVARGWTPPTQHRSTLRFINELTGETKIIEVNAAELIASGRLDFEVKIEDNLGGTPNAWATAYLVVHFEDFVGQILATMGIGTQDIAEDIHDVSVLLQRWAPTLAYDGKYDHPLVFPEKLVAKIQEQLPDVMIFRPRQDLDEALADLVTAANILGLSICLGLVCIETDIWGPAVWTTNAVGNITTQLAEGYTWPAVVTAGRLGLQE